MVFTVTDIAATCAFYARALGMEVVTCDEGRTALPFGRCTINLHQQGRESEPTAAHPAPGTQDMCFVTRVPIEDVGDHLRTLGLDISAGPVRRTGALGTMASIYLRDPDGNLVEIAHDGERSGPS